MNRQAKDNFLVLVADDSADDRFLLRTAMRRATRLQVVAEATDGEETISFIKKQLAARAPNESLLPDLLLLDLRMPVKDGFDVLKWLRAQRLERLTVVALTDSMEPDHIRQALELGADLFQVKPKVHHEWVAMVLALEQYLLTASIVASPRHFSETVELPPVAPQHRSAASAPAR
jgi:CheY-like chemotaxis protein